MKINILERFLQALHALEGATADLVDLMEEHLAELNDVMPEEDECQ